MRSQEAAPQSFSVTESSSPMVPTANWHLQQQTSRLHLSQLSHRQPLYESIDLSVKRTGHIGPYPPWSSVEKNWQLLTEERGWLSLAWLLGQPEMLGDCIPSVLTNKVG